MSVDAPSTDVCPICLEDTRRTIRAETPCKHAFCMRCLLRCADRRCPMCRADLAEHFPESVPEATLLIGPFADWLALEPYARWQMAVPRYNLRRPRLMLRSVRL